MNNKTTVTTLNVSVGADNGQSQSVTKHSNSITDNNCVRNLQSTGTPVGENLETVSMEELYDTVYPIKKPLVEDLIYNGVYLFVGAPKVGKSFLMAEIGFCVSAGIDLWGHKTNQGTVLYLALEDDYARLQQRLSRMFGIDVAEHFYFATRSKNLNEGLEEQLKEFLVGHADTRLVIIDTLQKIKEISGDKFSYANDYDIITKLKHFADEHNICILVVHHTRKMDSSDAFEMISGTNGLLGAADGAFIMQKEKRTDLKATVDITGRDQQDQKLYLKFDPKLCLWKFEKAETELWKEPEDKVLSAVNTYLMEAGCFQGTASELMDKIQEINLVPNQLTRQLNIKAGRLYEDYGIRYDNKRCHDGRIITLEYEKE
ncbi:AAA family ATPase [Eubacterium sp.]